MRETIDYTNKQSADNWRKEEIQCVNGNTECL